MTRKKTITDAKCPPYGGETGLKHIRKARQCLLRYMSDKMVITASTPDEVVIEKFAENQGLSENLKSFLMLINADAKIWLMQLYHSGTNDIIHKEYYAFYASKEWRELREWALNFYGRKCMNPKCKFGPIKSDTDLHIDHIKPKAKFPDLALDKDNVQVLCVLCNRTKSDRGMKDYRTLPEGFITTPAGKGGFETFYVSGDGKYLQPDDGGPLTWHHEAREGSEKLMLELLCKGIENC